MLLAADIGGTKTRLGLFTQAPERPVLVDAREFVTLDYPHLGAMITEFLVAAEGAGERIDAACFGVAGPVLDEAATLTNVPWRVDAREIAEPLPPPTRVLLNDLVAMAYAVPVLRGNELAVLQEGDGVPDGQRGAHRRGHRPRRGGPAQRRRPLRARRLGRRACRLRRADAARNGAGPRADAAVRPRRLRARDLGQGLINLYRFTHTLPCAVIRRRHRPGGAAGAADGRAAMEERCASCMDAFDLFISAYGSEAGNLALRVVATAGVYVGGGIAPKILPALVRGTFLDAFRSKAPMVDLLAAVPVRVILNHQAGLIGAAVFDSETE